MTTQERIYNLSKGVESLSKEEHGLFFEIVQRLGLSNDVKQAAIVLYLDFKGRPISEYSANRKSLDIFLIASVSLAAKAMGDLRTDQEIASKMLVNREKLVDAEERIMRSFRVQDSIIPLPEIVSQLTQRQIQSMAESFAQRGLVGVNKKDELVRLSHHYLDSAFERGLNPKLSYRGRAAGAVLKAARDLELPISEMDIARATGLDKKSVTTNVRVITGLLTDSKGSS